MAATSECSIDPDDQSSGPSNPVIHLRDLTDWGNEFKSGLFAHIEQLISKDKPIGKKQVGKKRKVI